MDTPYNSTTYGLTGHWRNEKVESYWFLFTQAVAIDNDTITNVSFIGTLNGLDSSSSVALNNYNITESNLCFTRHNVGLHGRWTQDGYPYYSLTTTYLNGYAKNYPIYLCIRNTTLASNIETLTISGTLTINYLHEPVRKLKIGSTTVNTMYLGNTSVSHIYLGGTMVYSKESTTPPAALSITYPGSVTWSYMSMNATPKLQKSIELGHNTKAINGEYITATMNNIVLTTSAQLVYTFEPSSYNQDVGVVMGNAQVNCYAYLSEDGQTLHYYYTCSIYGAGGNGRTNVNVTFSGFSHTLQVIFG